VDNRLPYRARVCAPDALTPAELASWARLNAGIAHLSSPFLSAHYARAAAAAGMPVRVCVISQADRAVGFLPFQAAGRIEGLLGSAEPAGAEMTDYFGLVAEPECRIAPADLLRLAGLNHLNFSHLDESQLAYGLQGEQPRVGLRIRLDRNAAEPLAALLADNPKYRKDSERRARQLAKEVGAPEFVLDVTDQREALLERLIEHKRAQYRRTGAFDALAAPERQRLLHQLLSAHEPGCRSMLSTLSAGGEWVAMHYGLLGSNNLQYWLPVYNPEMSKYAPGRLLIHSIIEASRQAGIHLIDRGEGDTPSKRELANEEHRYLRGAWHHRSVASFLCRGLLSVKWRLAAI